MDQENQIRDLIDRYLKGQLEGEELQEIESRIGEEDGFAEKVEQRREVLAALAVAGREALRERFKRIHQEIEAEESGVEENPEGVPEEEIPRVGRSSSRRWVWLSIAATILILIIPIYFWLIPGSPSSNELYTQYFQPGKDRTFTVDRSDGDPGYSQGVEQFKQGNYQDALPIFSGLSETYPDSLIFHLYSGVCQLGLKEPAKARSEFNFLLNRELSYDQLAAEWYQGLSYLQEDNPEAARGHFETIRDSGIESIYSEQAIQLLEQME